MMKIISLFQILEMHRQIIAQSGGSLGIRDFGALESALAQPTMTFDKKELYPTVTEKTAALTFSLAMNHPFVDGNKRIAHAAMEVFLFLNGHEINATVDEQEELFLNLASGKLTRGELSEWIKEKSVSKTK
ncbi:type II toxin-antitoxin system death-on-curing family toxin [candidate division KSB1 bacterium]|nr:type II toxin-antitoxin system death-on-curing family toxin [candidate division KSB1 bacterium]